MVIISSNCNIIVNIVIYISFIFIFNLILSSFNFINFIEFFSAWIIVTHRSTSYFVMARGGSRKCRWG